MLKKIIWIEDDTQLMQSSSLMFTNYGFEIIPCPTIALGLQSILDGKAPNVLLDIVFSNNPSEGIVFLEQVRKMNVNLRFAILTGTPRYSDQVYAIGELMAEAYFTKPIPFNEKERKYFFQALDKIFVDEIGPSTLSPYGITFRNTLGLISESLNNGKVEKFIELCKSIFADFSYQMKVQESYFHAYMHLLIKLADLTVLSEVTTNEGRIDMEIQTPMFIYIVEFKIGKAEAGAKQILNKNYSQKYLFAGKKIALLAISFDPIKMNISGHHLQWVEPKNYI